MAFDRDPRVKLLTLREYRSSEGRTYFKGWLGDAVVLMFKDEEAEPDFGSVAVWNMHVTPKKSKLTDGQRAPVERRRRPSPRKRPSAPASAPFPNDEIPF